MTDLTMPMLSESMEEGTILRWLKRDGDTVAAGEDLVEIEADKATVVYAAEAAGALEVIVSEGSTVPVGAVIARVGAGGRRPAAVRSHAEDGGTRASTAPADVPTPPAATPVAHTPQTNRGAPAAGAVAVSHARPIATPLARRAARAHGIDLDRVRGSGPRERITRADVLQAAGVADAAPATPAAAPVVPTAQAMVAPPSATSAAHARDTEEFEVREPSRIQQLTARRMAEAKATVPDFEVQADVVMDRAIAMRSALRELDDDESVPSINDFVVKACAIALRRHPRVNGSYVDGHFRLHRRVNVGVAVASEDALSVPTVFDADTKSLGAIANETRSLAARVRSGEITPPELSGGTFTVSNLGMFGMTSIRPVINLPQAAIVGVGAIREELARIDGEIMDRRVMTMTLTADHRILYGADAAAFLADVKALLESPLKLAL